MLASEIMDRARRVIQDETSVRWPLPELRLWLNDGQREIVLHKPTALSKAVALTLVAGTYQTIPPEYVCILRVTRNLASAEDPRQGGRAITTVDRTLLDAQNPDWHSERHVRQRKQVANVCYEADEPRAFWVYPGNDGTGVIEAIVSRVPTPVPAPITHPDELSSYNVQLQFDDVYLNALVDFILYRAYSKDSQFAGSAARAAAHYQLFANAVGLKLSNERARNPNTKPPVQEENAA